MSQKTEELWQEVTEAGEPIPDKGLSRPEAAAGALHMAAHVWIWKKNGKSVEILVQKRASDKPTWPGYFDISAAGHVDFGETPVVSAIRETREEIGLEVSKDQLRLLFVYRQNLVAVPSGIIENELQWVYGIELSADVTLAFEDGEVESAVWLSIEAFRDMISGKNASEKIVPHGDIYFDGLLKEIRRLTA